MSARDEPREPICVCGAEEGERHTRLCEAMSAEPREVTHVCMFPLGCEHKPRGEKHIHTTMASKYAPVIAAVLAEVARQDRGEEGKGALTPVEYQEYKAALAIRGAMRLKAGGASA